MFRAFDPVVIRLSLDASNVQREKIVFELVKPFIPGFSVETMEVDTPSTEDQQLTSAKRKAETKTTTSTNEEDNVTTEESPTPKVKAKKNKKSKK